MTKCDLCYEDTPQTFRIPKMVFQAAVDQGFNPFKNDNFDTTFLSNQFAPFSGPNIDIIFRDWRNSIPLTPGDWELCPTCHEAFRADTGIQQQSLLPPVLDDLSVTRKLSSGDVCKLLTQTANAASQGEQIRRFECQRMGLPSDSTVDQLIDLIAIHLQHEEPSVRERAALCLGRVGRRAQTRLEDMLLAFQDVDAQVRAAAARAIWSSWDPLPSFLSPSLLPLLSDEDSEVRYYALNLLFDIHELPHPLNIEVLLSKAMNDRACRVRILAATLSWRRDKQNGIRPLVDLVLGEIEGPCKRYAMNVLRKVKSDAINILREYSNGTEAISRNQAKLAAKKLTPWWKRIFGKTILDEKPTVRQKPFDTFLSYQSESSELARSIVEALIARNINIWFAEYSIPAANRIDFERLMLDGVDNSQTGLLLLSKNFSSSNYTMAEVKQMLAEDGCGKNRMWAVITDTFDPKTQLELPLENCSHDSHVHSDLASTISFVLDKFGFSSKAKNVPIAVDLAIKPSREILYYNHQFNYSVTLDHLVGPDEFISGKFEETSTAENGSVLRGESIGYGSTNINWNLITQERSDLPLRQELYDDRELFDALLHYARGYMHIFQSKFGLNPRLIGTHLFNSHGTSQFAITYQHDKGIVRRYSIVVENPNLNTNSNIEFCFLFFCETKSLATFCALAPRMDRVVKSFQFLSIVEK